MLPPRAPDLPPAQGPSPRRTLRAARRAAVALMAVAGLTAAGLAIPAPALSQPGTTAPEPAGPDPAGSAPAVPPGAAAESYEITLVTGDRVELTVDAGGRYGVEVKPARRPAGDIVLHTTRIGPDGVYVLPSDAVPMIQSGLLDRELFHVSYLAEHGYADADSQTLPLIVSYPEPVGAAARSFAPDAAALAGRAARLPAAADTIGLTSINGAGVALAKDAAARFWHQLRGQSAGTARAGGPGGSVARVWLDATAEMLLDESVPLVGAPQAWDAGYDGTGTTVAVVDTGVDQSHPDLTGQVSTAESFVEGEPARDTNGHGTHVASTIAGTGAASDGRYTGVAPGAELLSGKVCDSSGQCPFSSMIAGMEWAAAEMDADVVSMSIGGLPTDGTDPLSQAVDNLTASTGALFVISAGNIGGPRTVTTPASADAAMAVAATDKSDGLAFFSSRGPRYWDMALKPDIAAPGVQIVAARAEGTNPGPPVGESYTTLSGTSMAAPHVSGAAAILAQRYPDWQAAQLKAALMSTATDAGHHVYEQGAGRLDVARAATQAVFATTANLDFGIVELAREGQPEPGPVTGQVNYTNPSDQPVTLALAPTLAGTHGEPVPASALTTDATVTVPAGGSATVDVTLDVAGLDIGWYSGALVATDSGTGTRVTTPVGLVLEVPKVNLTIHTLGRDGQHVDPASTFLLDVAGAGSVITELKPVGMGVTLARAPVGTYHIGQLVGWTGDDSRRNAAWLLEPELTIEEDMEITLDAREAVEITFETPEASEPLSNFTESFLHRTSSGGQPYISFFRGSAWTHVWATPTDQVTEGELRFMSQWTLGETGVEMSVREPAQRALHPATPMNFLVDGGWSHVGFPDYVPFDGTRDFPVVDAGGGMPEDLAGLDLTGRLALVEVGMAEDPFGPACGLDIRVLEAVRDAGAAALVGFPSADSGCPIPMTLVNDPDRDTFPSIGIRHAYLPTQEGLELRAQLAAGPVAVRVEGTPQTPHTNVLKPYEDGRIPDSLHYDLTGDQLAVFDLAFHAPGPDKIFETRYVWKEGDVILAPSLVAQGPASIGPDTRREYVGPVGPGIFHLREAWYGEIFPDPNDRQRVGDLLDEPVRVHERWFAEPQTPGPAIASEAAYELVDPDEDPAWGEVSPLYCTLCWEGNMLAGMSYMVSGPPGELEHDDHRNTFLDVDYRVFRDGTEIPLTPMGAIIPTFALPEGTADYRIEREGQQNTTTWTFRSGPPAEGADPLGYRCLGRDFLRLHEGPCGPVPAVFVSYDLGDTLAMDNTVQAPGAQWIDVHAYHHPSPYPTPQIAGLNLSVSYDGKDWTPVQVRPAGDGKFEAKLVHRPGRHRASDQVSLKVEAWDVDGNRIEQITRDAFTLADRSAAGGAF